MNVLEKIKCFRIGAAFIPTVFYRYAYQFPDFDENALVEIYVYSISPATEQEVRDFFGTNFDYNDLIRYLLRSIPQHRFDSSNNGGSMITLTLSHLPVIHKFHYIHHEIINQVMVRTTSALAITSCEELESALAFGATLAVIGPLVDLTVAKVISQSGYVYQCMYGATASRGALEEIIQNLSRYTKYSELEQSIIRSHILEELDRKANPVKTCCKDMFSYFQKKSEVESCVRPAQGASELMPKASLVVSDLEGETEGGPPALPGFK